MTSAADPLPARIADFSAGPLESDAVATRRSYHRGRVRIDVTLARFPMTTDEYQRWVETSTAGFPQAVLDVAPADANGFYQCTSAAPPRCDLLVQLRSGVHLELRGSGTSSREDVDALARGLPLRALAAPAR